VVEKSKEGFRQALLKHFPEPDIFTNKDRIEERCARATWPLKPTNPGEII
jgi:phosphoribosylaminoimidazole-succinocarboxamide synthase